jgi:NADH-ubiquinone oxidoreductase chain 2
MENLIKNIEKRFENMFEHDFLTLFPEIFLINATIILLIYGVVFSTSKKYDYPSLVHNVSWLGLLNVVDLGGCIWENEG